ncbi:uncharacterized protein BX663DRAFT_513149 [Cokeromyces recurvatus]|uniref:uncharacterized protein n=1 Tax=Cokeromyces recurvatus TaxID=90255 RepID=UPI00221E9134|nr:uncharacterized protein BX663DRAFT_513149 [Cokeromyces recurvatus]KAI7901988.1 hypothetical protein BX663DRAFT_513149 [Cokeromyces recurvatus]
MARIIEYTYRTGTIIMIPQHKSSGTSFLFVQLVMGCFIMFSLIVDFFILTTSKLNVANWYWQPGILFFILTCGSFLFTIIDIMIVNNDIQLGSCMQRFTESDTSYLLLLEICHLKIRLNHLFTMAVIMRDFFTSGLYVTASYYYMFRLIQTLQRRDSLDTAMHLISNNYNSPSMTQ